MGEKKKEEKVPQFDIGELSLLLTASKEFIPSLLIQG